MPNHRRVVIVGGGIGGLTAATALLRSGFDVCVLEQAAEYRSVGAGITVQINAMQALRQIDLCEALMAVGNTLETLTLRFADGRHVFSIDSAGFAREFGAPFLGLYRGRLHEVLYDALDPARIKLDWTAQALANRDGHLLVTSSTGQQVEADVVIGADGLHSVVRDHLWGKEPPRYTGYTSWRAVIPDPGLSPRSEAGETWGGRSVFGYVPLYDDQLYWFATHRADEGGSDESDPREKLSELLAAWHAPIPEIVRRTDPASILRTDIRDRPVRFPWGRGLITLLGDAAHPMTPNLGQGAGQAIEDAVILARTLSTADSPEGGLRAYEQRRHRRTKRIVNHSRMLTKLAHGDGVLMKIARRGIFPYLPATVRKRQMRDIYRFNP